MFNVLISGDSTAWETDQLMRMDASRFGECSGAEGVGIAVGKPKTLLVLESVPALLLYERRTEGPQAAVVRCGFMSDIKLVNRNVVFRFAGEGTFQRTVFDEFAARLDIGPFEQGRTHWAVKDGALPSQMLARLHPTYDVVLSFAGEDRGYVEQAATQLREQGVRVFYDNFEQSLLWGKYLVEHFDLIFRRNGRYCVMFISQNYVQKVWTRQERRFALARALEERREYVLPARFDNTEAPGVPPTLAYIAISEKSPSQFTQIVLQKLGRTS
jgi:hypothetical protein